MSSDNLNYKSLETFFHCEAYLKHRSSDRFLLIGINDDACHLKSNHKTTIESYFEHYASH